jgi:hypothetical protein
VSIFTILASRQREGAAFGEAHFEVRRNRCEWSDM